MEDIFGGLVLLMGGFVSIFAIIALAVVILMIIANIFLFRKMGLQNGPRESPLREGWDESGARLLAMQIREAEGTNVPTVSPCFLLSTM